MASFTDKAPTFNPYVQQQPIEAMVKVGMYKQQQYDQNLERIQATMNKVAGLDIVRDADRDYLNTKMNKVVSKLQNFAAGDFSNANLTRSVTGMISNVGNDKNVQSAVFNSARYRKEYQSMVDAKKAGKSSAANEAVFMEDANKWLGSTDLEADFNASYSQYYDVDAKWFEVFKGLHPSVNSVDIPYVENEDGTINYGKTASAMKKIAIEKVSAAQIEQAIRARLSPEEVNQLSINARYSFRGVEGEEALMAYSVSNYNTKLKNNETTITRLKALRDVAGDAGKQQYYEDLIKEYEDNKTTLTEQAKEEANYIKTNPEAAKRSIYKNTAITQFAQAHAWENKETSFLTNPIKADENWERKFTFEKNNEWWDRAMDRANYDLKSREVDAEERQADAAEEANKPFTWGTRNTLGTEKGYDPFAAYLNVADNATNKATQAFEDMLPKNATDEQRAALQKKLDAFEAGEGDVDAAIYELATIYSNQKQQARVYKDKLADLTEQAESSPKYIESLSRIENLVVDAVAENPTISVPMGDDEVMEFGTDEMFALLSKINIDVAGYAGSPENKTPKTYFNVSTDRTLTPREQRVFDHLGQIKASDVALAPNSVGQRVNSLLPIRNKYRDVENIKEAYIKEELGDILNHYSPVSYNLGFTTKRGAEGREWWGGVLSDIISDYVENDFSMGGGNSKVSEEDITFLDTQLQTKAGRDAMEFKTVYYDGKSYLRTQVGGKVIDLEIKPDIARQLPKPEGLDDEYTKFIKLSQDFNDGRSSNYYDNNPITAAAVKRNEFYNLNKFKAVGNYNRNKSNIEMNYPEVRVILKDGTSQVIHVKTPMTIPNAKQFFGGLSDKHLVELVIANETISPEFKTKVLKQANFSEEEIALIVKNTVNK